MGETSKTLLPDYQDGSFTSNLKLELHRYLSVFTYKGKLHHVPGPDPMHANVGLKAIFWRVAVESLSMFFLLPAVVWYPCRILLCALHSSCARHNHRVRSPAYTQPNSLILTTDGTTSLLTDGVIDAV